MTWNGESKVATGKVVLRWVRFFKGSVRVELVVSCAGMWYCGVGYSATRIVLKWE